MSVEVGEVTEVVVEHEAGDSQEATGHGDGGVADDGGDFFPFLAHFFCAGIVWCCVVGGDIQPGLVAEGADVEEICCPEGEEGDDADERELVEKFSPGGFGERGDEEDRGEGKDTGEFGGSGEAQGDAQVDGGFYPGTKVPGLWWGISANGAEPF